LETLNVESYEDRTALLEAMKGSAAVQGLANLIGPDV